MTHGEIFSHMGHTGLLTVNKMSLPSMYRRRWHHTRAFIGRNAIALWVQRFTAGAYETCLTYATDWWAVIGPVIHGESKSQATPRSSNHVGLLHTVNNRHSRVKTRGATCIGGFDQTDGRRKFELGIPQSRGKSYIRGAPYITDKTVVDINQWQIRSIIDMDSVSIYQVSSLKLWDDGFNHLLRPATTAIGAILRKRHTEAMQSGYPWRCQQGILEMLKSLRPSDAYMCR